ncbi:MAG: RHS repeat-associated core domain-containing protein [Aquisalimonadaceae bacterium]
MLALSILLLIADALGAAPGIRIVDAGAEFAGAHYQESAIDLRVKVQGGFITHQRRLDGGERWQFNPAWADLELTHALDADPVTAAPTLIRRNGYPYRPGGGSGTPTYIFDERQQISRTESGYRWTDRLGNAIDYDHAGRIVSYNDRNQVYVHFTRNADGRISTVQDHARTTILSYHYTAAGELARVVDYSGRDVRYTYQDGRLAEVTDVLGETWRYGYGTYDGLGGRLTQRIDPLGNTRVIEQFVQRGVVCTKAVGGRWQFIEAEERWVYTGARCLQHRTQPPLIMPRTVRDGEGVVAHYSFYYDEDTKQHTVTEIDGGNGLRTRTYNQHGEVVEEGRDGRTTAVTDLQGRTRTRTDERGNRTVTTLDEWRNPLRTTHPDGSTTRRTWNPQHTSLLEAVNENGVVTRHDYDTRGNRLRTTEAAGLPEQRITEYGYDAFGNTTSIHRVGDAGTADATITLTYDAYGNLQSRTDAEGHRTDYLRHDVLGNVLEMKDARGHVWQYQYDAAGNLTREHTPLGLVTHYGYDGAGNLVTVTDAHGKITRMDYDSRNRLVRVTNPLDEATRFAYDGADRMIAITDALGHTRQTRYTRDGQPHAVIDALGQTIEMEYGGADGSIQNLRTGIDYPTYRQRFEYDLRNRLVRSEDQADDAPPRATAYRYDAAGNLLATTDADLRVTEYDVDALNRTTRLLDPAGQLTELAFDSRDNLVQVTNARAIVLRRYQYDRNDRLLRELLPDAAALAHRHDPNGNLIETIDPNGQAIRYAYDADNRLLTVRHFTDAAGAEDATSAVREINFSYDDLNRMSGYDDGQTRAQYHHDAAGRLLGVTVDYGPFSLGYSYTYYPNGLKESFTGPDGITYTYSYNANGELTDVQLPGQGTYTVDEYRWTVPAQITLPGGGRRNLDYDGYLRPSRIQGLDPATNPVQEDAYHYSAVDNILNRATLRGDYGYDYDAADRLTGEDGPARAIHYAYDPVGNRLSESDSTATGAPPPTWEYDANDRLLRRGPIHYSYDAGGNLTLQHHTETGAESRYRYDVDNRLIDVRNQHDALVARYAYDPFGRRIRKTVGDVTTHYLYAEEGLVAELDAAGTVITSYGYAPDSVWGTNPLFIKQGNQFGYYHNDHLGTPQAITAANGALLWSATYDAFGQARVTTEAIRSNLRFPGQYYDQETGLHYNWHRYYDPGTGRYITSDPIGLMGGLNTYLYAAANPLRYIDPDGHQARTPNPWDHVVYPPEHNCSCTIDCMQDAGVIEAVCGSALKNWSFFCRPILWMTCGQRCANKCKWGGDEVDKGCQ